MYRVPKLARITDQWCKCRRIRCSNLKTDLHLFFCSERQLQFNVLPWQPDCKCFLYLLYLMLEITEVLWKDCVFHDFCFHNAVMRCVHSSCALGFLFNRSSFLSSQHLPVSAAAGPQRFANVSLRLGKDLPEYGDVSLDVIGVANPDVITICT